MIDRLRDNLGEKVVALCLTLVLYIYVNAERNPMEARELAVPLRLAALPADFLPEDPPQAVTVTVYGPRALVAGLNPKSWEAVADLSDAREGLAQYPVRYDLQNIVLRQLRIERPETVAIHLVRRVRTERPIRVDVTGSPPTGFSFLTTRVEPARAQVSGPEDVVARARSVVAKVDAPPGAEGVEGTFALVALDERGNALPVDVEPDRVQVRVALVEEPAARRVYVSPNLTGQPPYPLQVEDVQITPTTVLITGRPERLEQVRTVPTRPIDLSRASATFTRTIALEPPPGVTVSQAPQVAVRVVLRRVEVPAPVPPPARPAPVRPPVRPPADEDEAPAPPAT